MGQITQKIYSSSKARPLPPLTTPNHHDAFTDEHGVTCEGPESSRTVHVSCPLHHAVPATLQGRRLLNFRLL